jgi:probable HAF family extracellular repeat protein
MFKKTILFYCICLTFCLANALAYADSTYRLKDLGFQESDKSEAVAVNDRGQVAGMYWMLSQKYYFIWDKKEGVTLIDLPSTAKISVLNNICQIAGEYLNNDNQCRGFIWGADTGFMDIGTLGGMWTCVNDMNDLGQIVGESECEKNSLIDKHKEKQAFVWHNGEMCQLEAITGDLGLPGDHSIATGINNHGQIAGTSVRPIAHKGKLLRSNHRPVIWQNGNVQEVIYNNDTIDSYVSYNINNHGIAIYKSTKYTLMTFVYDASTTECANISFAGQNVRISDSQDLYRGGDNSVEAAHMKKGASWNEYAYAYLSFAKAVDVSDEWKPKSFCGFGFNNDKVVVGKAENIYGEWHAVMLMPLKQTLETIDDNPISQPEKENEKVEKPIILLGPMIADFRGGDSKAFTEEVRQALLFGSDPNDVSRNNHRPLQLALRNRLENVAIFLIEHGANVTCCDNSNCTPVELAINGGMFQIADLLIKKGAYFDKNAHAHNLRYNQFQLYQYIYIHRG